MKRDRRLTVDEDVSVFDDITLANVNFGKDDFPAQHSYWDLVGIIQTLTPQGVRNRMQLNEEKIISRYCARSIRKVKNCSECLHFYECLNAGHTVCELALEHEKGKKK